MKTGVKRCLALLMVAVMLMCVAPLSFAEERHPSYGSIEVGDKSGNSRFLSIHCHYYKNDAESSTDDPEGANVSYDEETGIMILDNYDGSEIRFKDYGDVTIILKGTNIIRGGQFGIYCGYGNLTLTSEDEAVLNISNSTGDSGGIVTDWNPKTDYNLTVSGNLSINIETAFSANKDFNGLRAGGKLSILDNANVSVKGKSDVDYCHIYGLRGASLFLDTTGTVSVETGNTVYYCYALSFNSVEIKNVKEFNIKSIGENRYCIIYNDDAYNSLINPPGFDVVSETDDTNHFYLTIKKHTHSFNDVVTAPKANSLGYTTHTCVCGYSYKDSYKAPTGKPAGLKCTARTAQAMKFTWNKTSGVTGYQVQILNAKGGNAGLKALTGNVYTFTKLAAGHAYKARVRFFIKAADGKNYFGAWSTITSPTLPAGSAISKLTPAKKAFTAQWKKASVTGYQLQYATNAKFTKAAAKTVKGAAKVKLAVKSLKGGAKYYVRIRTYKTIGGKNYYSAWSAAKTVTTKAAVAAVKKPVSHSVYITPTGKRYHYDSKCGNGKYIKSTLKEALKKGLTPCKKCVH